LWQNFVILPKKNSEKLGKAFSSIVFLLKNPQNLSLLQNQKN